MSEVFWKDIKDTIRGFVFGHDSARVPIIRGDMLLYKTDAGTLHLGVVQSADILKEKKRGIVVQDVKDAASFSDFYTVDIIYRDSVENLQRVGFARLIEGQVNLIACREEGVNFVITVSYKDGNDFIQREFTLLRGQTIWLGESYLLSLIERDEDAVLVVASLRSTDKFPSGEMQHEPVERIDSQEAVIDRLQIEFPWFSRSDLFQFPSTSSDYNYFIRITLLELAQGLKGRVDTTRLHRIYAAGRESEIQNPNEYELLYIAARDYCRIVDFSYSLSGEVVPEGEQFSRNRFEVSSRNFAELEKEVINFIRPRWQEEVRLFGQMIDSEPWSSVIFRYASSDTIGRSDVVGIFYDGIQAVLRTDYSHAHEVMGRDVVGITDRTGRGVLNEARNILIKIVEIVIHELEHFGHKNFGYEEVFNAWKGGIRPCQLQNKTPAFNFAYYFKAGTPKSGGAWTLVSMIDEASELAGDKAFEIYYDQLGKKDVALWSEEEIQEYDRLRAEARDDVLRAAYITAFSRILHNKGENVVLKGSIRGKAFGDVYEELTGKKFEDEVKGCSDTDYDQANKKIKEADPIDQNIEAKNMSIDATFLRVVHQHVEDILMPK
jgi:hypothetical protein